MANDIRTFAAKDCVKCGRTFVPTAPNQRQCNEENCDVIAERRAKRQAPANGRVVAASSAPSDPAPEADTTENGGAPNVLDVIDAFALDFNLGNAIRFVLEKDDGDALQNLREAHIYLERAIARLEASSR